MISRSGVVAIVVLGHLAAIAVGKLGAPELALTSAAFLGLAGVTLLTSIEPHRETFHTEETGTKPDGSDGALPDR